MKTNKGFKLDIYKVLRIEDQEVILKRHKSNYILKVPLEELEKNRNSFVPFLIRSK